MQILGCILIIVGMVLIIVGRNLSKQLPPNYQENEEDGFLQLLQSMGNLVVGAGIILLIIGFVCMFL